VISYFEIAICLFIKAYILINYYSLKQNSNTAQAVQNSNLTSSANPNSRLMQFNRLATERKTVHVMSSNINKDLQNKRDKLLNSYNQPHLTGAGGAATSSGVGNLNSNTLTHQSYVPGQSTLDYTMNSRSNTNTGSFLQKLSSKFSRR
jgi:hypothetical protein